jgi:hypothetical protein
MPAPREPHAPVPGLAEIIREVGGTRGVAALYLQNGRIWFQYREQKWDVSAGRPSAMHTTSRLGLLCDFHLLEEGASRLKVRYWNPTLLASIFDMTFDVVDREFGDFFFFVTHGLSDPTWIARLATTWVEAPPAA